MSGNKSGTDHGVAAVRGRVIPFVAGSGGESNGENRRRSCPGEARQRAVPIARFLGVGRTRVRGAAWSLLFTFVAVMGGPSPAVAGQTGTAVPFTSSNTSTVASAGDGGQLAGGAENVKALWHAYAPVLFAIIVGVGAFQHYGLKEYPKLIAGIAAGALVGWVIADPSGHLSALGNDFSSLLQV